MKIVISRDRFINILNTVKDAAGGGSIAVLNNIKLETKGDDKLVATATNLDVTVSAESICQVNGKGAVTVPAKMIVPMVNALTAAEVEFEWDGKANSKAILTGGEVTYKLGVIPACDFPTAQPVEGPNVQFSSKMLKDLLRKTSYAASQDSTRKALMAVCFQGENNLVTAVATDGRRLAVDKATENFDDSFEVIVPPIAVKLIQKNLGNDDDVVMTIAENKAVMFKGNNWAVESKVVDDKYPNWKQVVPNNLQHNIVIERSRLEESVRQVSFASGTENPFVSLTFKTGVLVLSAANGDVSDAKVMIPIKYEGEDIKVALHPRYLLEALSSLDEDEIIFNLNNGMNPVTVTIKDNDYYLAVIMPLRIN